MAISEPSWLSGHAVVRASKRPARRDHRAQGDAPDPAKTQAKEHLVGAIEYRRRDQCAVDGHFAGAVAAHGSAGGTDLPTAVAPFILRASASNCGQDWVNICCPSWSMIAPDSDG
jgi:hypothetical protein